MRITAILNLKGGVAKTTTAVNMAAILARDYQSRVLLIDADSQCNTTEFFGADPTDGNLAGLLRHAKDHTDPVILAADCIQHTRFQNVDILPGDESLMDMDLSQVKLGTANANVLRSLAGVVAGLYDYILIDCPPAFNAASAAALIAADDVIIPIKLDAFSLRGMGNLMRQIKNMSKINPNLCLAGILPTMWYRSPQIIDAAVQLKQSMLPVFHHIRRSNKVDDMTFRQDALIITSPNSGAAVDYRRFVQEYVEQHKGDAK